MEAEERDGDNRERRRRSKAYGLMPTMRSNRVSRAFTHACELCAHSVRCYI